MITGPVSDAGCAGDVVRSGMPGGLFEVAPGGLDVEETFTELPREGRLADMLDATESKC